MVVVVALKRVYTRAHARTHAAFARAALVTHERQSTKQNQFDRLCSCQRTAGEQTGEENFDFKPYFHR